MQIAKVVGTVVSTYKEDNLSGTKFLMLQLIDIEGQLSMDYEVAADTVGAGVEEWVLVSRGSGARLVRDSEKRPIDAAVIAIIDTVSLDNYLLYSKKSEGR
ncbi:EutN/CcmL family microcompartment protein [Tumidithrix elongata RA019]|uniref:Carboxysome shell vertex protein CcmL n=1 Tax=Tumidithrix elongata BACA0141 TaxID=2716417 RepID=A0AAW9PTH7_9CYAN|nr:EutN/CcmL family microcompartment protein [Tumidithrix elongata RA019]